MDSTATVTEAQVDWITATRLSDVSQREMGELGVELLRLEKERGAVRQAMPFRGYKGWQCGRVYYGGRKDSTILCVAGSLADERFQDLRSCSDHFTRLDLAVTTRLDPPSAELAKERRYALEEGTKGRGFRAGWKLIETSAKGDTLYIGSRRSQFYGRLYDKQRESGKPVYAACWRWEVECKQAAARAAALDVAGAPDRRAVVGAKVRDYFARRGVQPVWSANDSRLHGKAWAGEPDLDRHTAWFQRTLKPLMEKYRGTPGYQKLLVTLGVPEELAAQASAASGLCA